LLRAILSAQLKGRDTLSSLHIMSILHSDRWYMHPRGEDEHHRVQFLLDKLVETQDLVKNEYNYQITGVGVAAIEIYEEQERKHGESIAVQRRMVWLTILIALLTLVQSGLVTFSPIF
jgi:hypothetical protein